MDVAVDRSSARKDAIPSRSVSAVCSNSFEQKELSENDCRETRVQHQNGVERERIGRIDEKMLCRRTPHHSQIC
jgi:hypothetical protein